MALHTDRVVHATLRTEYGKVEIVRYERAGKYYAEPIGNPDPKARPQAAHTPRGRRVRRHRRCHVA